MSDTLVNDRDRIAALERLADELPQDEYITTLLTGSGGTPTLSVGRRTDYNHWLHVVVSSVGELGVGYTLAGKAVKLGSLDSPAVAASRLDVALPLPHAW